MDKRVKIKMVAGDTYMCPPAFGPDRTIVRGEVVEVSEEHAAVLLDDSYTDALNNQHYYFSEVDEDTPEGAPDPDAPAPVKPVARSRKAK